MRRWIAPLVLCAAAFAEQAQEQRAPEARKPPKPRPTNPLRGRFPGNPVLVSDPVHGYRVVVPPPETRAPAPPETSRQKN